MEHCVECTDCGANIDPTRDRGLCLSDEHLLCFACALGRGGAYDEREERWIVIPHDCD
jgi:hypothetical protein